MTRPVEKRLPRYMSATTLSAWVLCPRKVGWERVDGLPRVQTKATLYGSTMHTHHEDYFKKGKPYDLTTPEGRSAQATSHLLPKPSPRIKVEYEPTFDFHGHLFGGKIDLHWFEDEYWPPRPVVIDHKSCGTLSYAKRTKKALLDDPQAPLYGTWACREYGTDDVELIWNYATRVGDSPTERVKTLQSRHIVTRDECESALETFLPDVEEMKRLLPVVQTARELPAHTGACAAFGGCAFRKQCGAFSKADFQLSAERANERTKRPKGTMIMSVDTNKPTTVGGFLAGIKNRQNGGQSNGGNGNSGAPAQVDVQTASTPPYAVNPPESANAKSDEETRVALDAEKAGKPDASLGEQSGEQPQKRTRRTKAEMAAARGEVKDQDVKNDGVLTSVPGLKFDPIVLEMVKRACQHGLPTVDDAKNIKAFCAELYS